MVRVDGTDTSSSYRARCNKSPKQKFPETGTLGVLYPKSTTSVERRLVQGLVALLLTFMRLARFVQLLTAAMWMLPRRIAHAGRKRERMLGR